MSEDAGMGVDGKGVNPWWEAPRSLDDEDIEMRDIESIKEDLRDIKETMRGLHARIEHYQREMAEDSKRIWMEIAVLKTKVAVYAVVAGAIVSAVFNLLFRHGWHK